MAASDGEDLGEQPLLVILLLGPIIPLALSLPLLLSRSEIGRISL